MSVPSPGLVFHQVLADFQRVNVGERVLRGKGSERFDCREIAGLYVYAHKGVATVAVRCSCRGG